MSKIEFHKESSSGKVDEWDSGWQEIDLVAYYYYEPESKVITREVYEEYTNLRNRNKDSRSLEASDVIKKGELSSQAKEKLKALKKELKGQ